MSPLDARTARIRSCRSAGQRLLKSADLALFVQSRTGYPIATFQDGQAARMIVRGDPVGDPRRDVVATEKVDSGIGAKNTLVSST